MIGTNSSGTRGIVKLLSTKSVFTFIFQKIWHERVSFVSSFADFGSFPSLEIDFIFSLSTILESAVFFFISPKVRSKIFFLFLVSIIMSLYKFSPVSMSVRKSPNSLGVHERISLPNLRGKDHSKLVYFGVYTDNLMCFLL